LAEDKESKESKAAKKPKSTSAQKQVRVSGRRQKRNKSVRSRVKTSITSAEKLIRAGRLDEARGVVARAVTSLDRAVGKGVIPSNNAGRRKSRLIKKLNAAVAASPAKPEPKESK
jgi:small subunit ribosomal protein S20